MSALLPVPSPSVSSRLGRRRAGTHRPHRATPSLSSSGSALLPWPSPSVSTDSVGVERERIGACPSTPSLSSSVSALLPVPSPSVSTDSAAFSGKASAASGTPSLSSSVSALLPVPSPSVSTDSAALSGNASAASATPSLSSSVSALLPVPSPSVSTDLGRRRAGRRRPRRATPSLSSSVSALLPVPSPSVSTDLGGVRAGTHRPYRGMPSLSSSVSALLPWPSPSVSTDSVGVERERVGRVRRAVVVVVGVGVVARAVAVGVDRLGRRSSGNASAASGDAVAVVVGVGVVADAVAVGVDRLGRIRAGRHRSHPACRRCRRRGRRCCRCRRRRCRPTRRRPAGTHRSHPACRRCRRRCRRCCRLAVAVGVEEALVNGTPRGRCRRRRHVSGFEAAIQRVRAGQVFGLVRHAVVVVVGVGAVATGCRRRCWEALVNGAVANRCRCRRRFRLGGRVQRIGAGRDFGVVRDAVVVVVGVDAVGPAVAVGVGEPSSTPPSRSLSTPSHTSGLEAAFSGLEPPGFRPRPARRRCRRRGRRSWPGCRRRCSVKPSSTLPSRSLSMPSHTSG